MATNSRRTRRKYRYIGTLEKRADVNDGFGTAYPWETVRNVRCSKVPKRAKETVNADRVIPVTTYEIRERLQKLDPPQPEMRIEIDGTKYEIGSVITDDQPPLEHVMECTVVR